VDFSLDKHLFFRLSYFGLSAIHPTISTSGPASPPNHKTGAKKLAVANSGNPTRHGNVKVPFFYLSADDFSSKKSSDYSDWWF